MRKIYIKYVEAFGVLYGIEYAWSRQKASCLRFCCLVCQKQNGFLWVPVLIEVAIFLVLYEESHCLFLHFGLIQTLNIKIKATKFVIWKIHSSEIWVDDFKTNICLLLKRCQQIKFFQKEHNKAKNTISSSE